MMKSLRVPGPFIILDVATVRDTVAMHQFQEQFIQEKFSSVQIK